MLNSQIHSGEDLIAPCHCRGTQKYVHRSCLDNWRSTKVCQFWSLYSHASLFSQSVCLNNWYLRFLKSFQEGFAFSHCTECRAVFLLRANVPPDRWWLRLKFQFLVARDHAFIFIIVQLVRVFSTCQVDIFVWMLRRWILACLSWSFSHIIFCTAWIQLSGHDTDVSLA